MEMSKRVLWGALAVMGVSWMAACGQNYSDKPAAEALAQRNLTPVGGQPPESVPAESATTGGRRSLGEVSVAVPTGWEAVAPSSTMRLAEYRVPAPSGGGGGELAVFAGSWGSVDDNVERWYGQFSQPDGGSTESVARRWNLQTEGGLEATLVDVSGIYSGGMGGGSRQPGIRMLGAIVDAGGRSYYLKLTGPQEEVAALEDGFVGMVRSMRRD